MSYKKDSQQAKRNAFGLRTIFSLFCFSDKNGSGNSYLGEVSPVDLVLLNVKEEWCHR